jgi:hypothetical protein
MIPLRSIAAAFVTLTPLAAGCTAHVSKTEAGVETYDGIRPGDHPLTYAFARAAPAWLERSLTLALAQWNQALGATRLRHAKPGADAAVEIDFTPTAGLPTHPGVAELAGCMEGLESFTTCRIRLDIPDRVDGAELLAEMSFLFRAGAIDTAMHASHTYVFVEDFLRDKLATLVLAHEIGHTLGLGHAPDGMGCLMAATPAADAAPCAAEVDAARRQLTRR